VDDFIFGTLATDDLRLAHIRSLKAGVAHNHARSPRGPLPGQEVVLELTVGPAAADGLPALDQAWVYWTDDNTDPQGKPGSAENGNVVQMQPAGVEWDTLLWGYVSRFRAVLPGQPRGSVVRYRLSASSPDGSEVFSDSGRTYAYYIDDDPPPAWAEEGVIYQIFVDRFHPGGENPWQTPDSLSGFFGGTLQGVLDRLDYLQDLGASVLWLSPIFPSPSHHGYDAFDYFEIEPRLGTKEDFRRLLDACHAREMRVILDFVPNHWSHLHPTFQDASSDPNSPYRDWYTFIRWPVRYLSFFDVPELPKINLRNPQARQHMLDAAAYWLEFGIDGYRVDHAIGPTPDFWADFRRVTRAVKPDCWSFGEVVDPPDLQLSFEGLLDGCLDFVLLEALRKTFAFGRWSGKRIASFLERHEAYFPPSFSRPSFLDNHDMNRFLWAARGDVRRLKLAALCQFTLAGPPVIYQGTELGLSQRRDVRQHGPEEARLPMPWGADQDVELLSYYRQLIALCKEHSFLRQGERKILAVGEDFLAYSRSDSGAGGAVVLNLSDRSQSIPLTQVPHAIALSTEAACQISHTGQAAVVDLPAFGGVLLI
jgi:cyclomaltodextrinase / maltogenic alpha-amylase / neopullulanase